MAREIKFQAINDEGKIIIPDYIDRHGLAWWKENSMPTCTKRIRQFTGRKDKNGKDVFEEDFINGKIIRMSEMISIKGKIEYSTELTKYIVGYKSPRGWDLHMDLSVFHEIEVIGNYFENPELIK